MKIEKENSRHVHWPFPVVRLVELQQEQASMGGYAGVVAALVNSLRKSISALNGNNTFSYEEGLLAPPSLRGIYSTLRGSGVVTGFYLEKTFNDQPPLFLMHLVTPHIEGVSDALPPKYHIYNNGVHHLSFETSFIKAIGEFAERFALKNYRESKLLKATPKELLKKKRAFLEPQKLEKFTKEQRAKIHSSGLKNEDPFLWVEGVEMLSGKKTLLPAQTVFWSYNLSHSSWKENFIRERNTNGCAAHTDRNTAINKAVYELVERDGFLLHWLTKTPPRRIDPNSFTNESLKSLIADCKRCSFTPVFLVTKTDLDIPSIAVALVNESEIGPKVVFGGGAGSSWEDIALSALTEALSVYTWARGKEERGEAKHLFMSKPDDTSLSSYGMDERVFLWANPAMFGKMEPFLSGEFLAVQDLANISQHFASPKGEFEYLKRLLASKGDGYELYVYEAEEVLIRNIGFTSVRAIIPNLVPMYFQESIMPIDALRLRSFSKTAFEKHLDIMLFPHPFP